MTDKVSFVPEGYHSVTPYLIVDDAAGAIEFYKTAFGAVELFRMPDGDRIGHAEIKIGTSPVMLADEVPAMGYLSAKRIGNCSVSLLVYVEDVDAVVARALDAGATLVRPIEDKFYGDRSGTVADPYGYQWHLATHVEDVSPEELQRRAAAAS
jgi:PhnB protein